MNKQQQKQQLAKKRAMRVRGKVHGTASRPRVSVHRTNQYVYAQAIDDDKQVTVASSSLKQMKNEKSAKVTGTKVERAAEIGANLASKLKAKKVDAVSFDRGNNRYHGRVKAIAEALREAGIKV